ncbi:hypothetical protein KAK06_01240 [Ideonella sp. 4Y11]|uniref:Lipoprotein n=1 Tax=Ideonella aquatica TaxID=2824119 RepID=A0A941BJK2_9BURK|nr:hypothetical protein [Ideonella aquatica]MBQ0957569.1 hypothetical protein [Ideonella aquatica]
MKPTMCFNRPPRWLSMLPWVAALLLAGCAIPKYQPPAGAAISQVRLYTTSSANASVIIGQFPFCGGRKVYRTALLGVANLLSQPETLGMPSPPAVPASQMTEVAIETGRPLSILASSMQTLVISPSAPVFDTCRAEAYFEPQAGERYEAVFERPGTGVCTVSVVQLRAASDGTWTRVPVSSLPKPSQACPN